LTFCEGNGGWKIYSIQKSQAGWLPSLAVKLSLKTEAAKLAVDTTLSFARAVNANDLKAFYAQTAAEFQHDVPFEKFNARFSPFIEHHINLAPVEKVAPLLTSEPGVSAQGVLQVEGYFRLRNPTSTSLTNTSIGLRIGRLWVSTSTSNLLTTKQYSFCFWLSASFRPSHGLPGSNYQVLVNAETGQVNSTENHMSVTRLTRSWSLLSSLNHVPEFF